MSADAETLPLPGAIGYRSSQAGDSQLAPDTQPPVPGPPQGPRENRTLVDLDEELGNDGDDCTSTQPGSPTLGQRGSDFGVSEMNVESERAREREVCLGFGTWGPPPNAVDDPEHPGFRKLTNTKPSPSKASIDLGLAEPEINPEPAMPGLSTPELGNPESPNEV